MRVCVCVYEGWIEDGGVWGWLDLLGWELWLQQSLDDVICPKSLKTSWRTNSRIGFVPLGYARSFYLALRARMWANGGVVMREIGVVEGVKWGRGPAMLLSPVLSLDGGWVEATGTHPILFSPYFPIYLLFILYNFELEESPVPCVVLCEDFRSPQGCKYVKWGRMPHRWLLLLFQWMLFVWRLE